MGRSWEEIPARFMAFDMLVDADGQDFTPPLSAGEMVTTGTVTRALPIQPGETWISELDGIPLPGLRVTFTA